MTTTTTEERQLRWFNELKKKEAVGAGGHGHGDDMDY